MGFVLSLSSARKALAAPEVPFLSQAYQAVEKNPTSGSVTATVTMTTLGTTKGPKILLAQGPLAMEGDLLGGRLPLTFDNSKAVAPRQHSLFFNVSKTGRIGLQWLVNNKPLEGRPMQAFDTDISSGTLTKKLTWNGACRLVTVSIERKLILNGGLIIKLRPTPKPIFNGGLVIKIRPTSTPKPKFQVGRLIIVKPKVAIGRRVSIKARLVVTNSDDGVGGIFGNSDKTVEMSGSILLGDQTAFSFSHRSARASDEFQSKAINSVVLKYSDPDLRFFQVKGTIYDEDKASAADGMWLANQKIDLLQIMNSNTELLIRGDHKSEGADLYIRVFDEGEVF